MLQTAQLIGAVLILVAFVAAQRGAWSPHSIVYLVLNLVGSVVLFIVALIGSDWGFLLLEVVWAIVSAQSLLQVLRGREPTGAH